MSASRSDCFAMYAVLFDAGFTPRIAARRGNREYLRSPMDIAAALGVPTGFAS